MAPPSERDVIHDFTPYPHRAWYTRVPFVTTKPSPPLANADDALLSPEHTTASWLARLTFAWISPVLIAGYTRPLETSDLFKLDESRSARIYGKRFLAAFEEQCTLASEHNRCLDSGLVRPSLLRKTWWKLKRLDTSTESKAWLESLRRKPSLFRALHKAMFRRLWTGAILKTIGDVGTIVSPLLVKAIISFGTRSWKDRSNAPPIGEGIGLAFGLLALQVVILFCNAHAFYLSITTGVLLRTGLIAALFEQALQTSPRARAASGINAGKLVAMVSTDISRIDSSMTYIYFALTAPIQIVLCLILLALPSSLSYSALPGFAFFIIFSPVQGQITKKLFRLRKASMVWTDKRIKLLNEALGNMRGVKLLAIEDWFLERIATFRLKEMKFLRTRLLLRSFNNAFAFSLPTLAAVISFVTYALTHPSPGGRGGLSADPSVIFSALSLFQLLRTPLTFLPVALNAVADATNAITRVREVLLAEVEGADSRPTPSSHPSSSGSSSSEKTFGDSPVSGTVPQESPALDVAIRVQNASFTWSSSSLSTSPASEKEKPSTSFGLKDISLEVPYGEFVAIVGGVGIGKSSLVQGLIGEMHCTKGTVQLGGSVAYCPQSAWIQSTTIRENITFGQPYDEARYQRVIEDVCLERDFELFKPHGDLTVVGEKGVSLSGGQRQRISLARALYSNKSISIFDDSLSALDAHVARRVFQNIFLRPSPFTNNTRQTRVLVTHALHFLPHADYIVVMDEGSDGVTTIAECGRYDELMSGGGAFSRFVTQFAAARGRDDDEESVDGGEGEGETLEKDDVHELDPGKEAAVRGEAQPTENDSNGATTTPVIVPPPAQASGASGGMTTEERVKGSVDTKVYIDYFRAANLKLVLPLFILAVAVFQGSSVMSPYWLVWWEDEKFPLSQGVYMAIYAALGICQALGVFLMGSFFALMTFHASLTLHRDAVNRLMRAPISFFDTTPLGRIMNRMSKDVDTIDNVIGDAMRMFMGTLVQIIGAVVLVSAILPWFLIAVSIILLGYFWIGLFYRASAREIKRLDAVLRSTLYSHFAEALTGLPTIRAYGEAPRFKRENERLIDMENRAYWLSVTNQRYLSVRLDFLGSLLVFAVALLAVGARYSINPSQTGVILSYILIVQQAFGWAVRQSAEVENNMNGIERMHHYATQIETEEPLSIHSQHTSSSASTSSWPTNGNVEFKQLVMRYRPDLKPALDGVTFSAGAGEHVAIVGRTGAGKSSIAAALYRLAPLSSGAITIDDISISELDLHTLRRAIACIPQEPVLFAGTIRSNLDPLGVHDDAVLWDALKRVHLVQTPVSEESDETVRGSVLDLVEEKSKEGKEGGESRPVREGLTLDSAVLESGENLSLGQRSLVSLARALVQNSRIIMLDEATASVDFATDLHIQHMLSSEFAHRTVLCIAHRIRTIVGYDRVVVMDAGRVIEQGSPRDLIVREDGVFKSLCERESIGEAEVVRAWEERSSARNTVA